MTTVLGIRSLTRNATVMRARQVNGEVFALPQREVGRLDCKLILCRPTSLRWCCAERNTAGFA